MIAGHKFKVLNNNITQDDFSVSPVFKIRSSLRLNISFSMPYNYSAVVNIRHSGTSGGLMHAKLPVTVSYRGAYRLTVLETDKIGQITLRMSYICPCKNSLLYYCDVGYHLKSLSDTLIFHSECEEYLATSSYMCCGFELGRKLHLFSNRLVLDSRDLHLSSGPTYFLKYVRNQLIYLALTLLAFYLYFKGYHSLAVIVLAFAGYLWLYQVSVLASSTVDHFRSRSVDSKSTPRQLMHPKVGQKALLTEKVPKDAPIINDGPRDKVPASLESCSSSHCEASFLWEAEIYKGFHKELEIFHPTTQPLKVSVDVLRFDETIESIQLYSTGRVVPHCFAKYFVTQKGHRCSWAEQVDHDFLEDLELLYKWNTDNFDYKSVKNIDHGWCPSTFISAIGSEIPNGYGRNHEHNKRPSCLRVLPVLIGEQGEGQPDHNSKF